DAFAFSAAVDVYENGKPTRRNFWVNAKSRTIISFPVTKNPDFINLNADGVLLAEITENKAPEQFFMQYTASKELLSRYKAVVNASENSANSSSLKTLTAAL